MKVTKSQFHHGMQIAHSGYKKVSLIQSSNDAQNQDAFSAQPAEDQAAQMQVEQSSQSSNDVTNDTRPVPKGKGRADSNGSSSGLLPLFFRLSFLLRRKTCTV